MAELLVVDDEDAIQFAFRRAFQSQAITVRSATTAASALEQMKRTRPDVVVLDVHLPDATGLETFRRIRQLDARIPVILVTGHGTAELAIEAIKEGAYDYLLKPLELPQLRELIDQAMHSSRLMNVPAEIDQPGNAASQGDLLVGRCSAMQEVYKAIGRVAQQDVTVLILGESGTGKELVARAIYQHSYRANKPFLAINCAAIPETLLESELFGHERGAFTGADRKRIGKFEQCHGGTIFLDEIGEMPALTQAKILRLIQEQRFERLGGEETVQTNVRLIAATNAALDRQVEEGRFRKDLYFRLNVFTIQLPSLRDRGDDIPVLIDYFFKRFSKELARPLHEIAPEVMAALQVYSWPGNVRELQSVIKQALLRMSGTVLLPDCLPPQVLGASGEVTAETPLGSMPEIGFRWDQFAKERIAQNTENLYSECLEVMERQVLMQVLQHTQGNQLRAAKILGITRGSLRTKIRALGINIARSISADDDLGEG